jgi:hypothetical protein
MIALRTSLALCLLFASACASRAVVSAPAPAVSPAPPQGIVATQVPRLSRPVTSFGAAFHQGALYVYGGYFGVPHEYSREGQSGELLRLDLDKGSTVSLLNGPGVQGAQLVSTPSGLLRVGGMRADNAKGEPERVSSLADIALYDPARGAFQALPDLPKGRSSHAAVAIENQVYVIGGWTLSGKRDAGEFAQDTLVFDLASKSVRSIAQPFRARALAAAALGGKIYVLGGMNEKAEVQRAVHVLDTRTGTWSRGPDYPEDAFGVAAVGQGESLYASARDGIVYKLEPPYASFQALTPLAFPRFFHQLVALDKGRIAALGGISGMHLGDRIAHIEVIDPAQPAPRVLSWTLHNPTPAKNRQGVHVHDDALIVFGGNRSLAQHDFAPEDFLREAYALSLASMRAQKLPDFPVARQTVQTVGVDDALVAIGGFGHDARGRAGAGSHARAQLNAYTLDADAAEWKPYGSELPEPRTQFGLVERKGALWVFGGLDFDEARAESAQFVHPLEVLSGKAGGPLAKTQIRLPRARRAFGGAVYDDTYFMIGGMAEGFAPVSECDVFTFESESWSVIPCPAVRISPQLVTLNGKLYLAGGSMLGQGEPIPNASIEVYDPGYASWSTLLPEIPIEPRHLSMRVYRHALVLFSSHREDGTAQIALVVP